MNLFLSWPHKVQRGLQPFERIRISRSGRIEILKEPRDQIRGAARAWISAGISVRPTKLRAMSIVGTLIVLLLAGLVAFVGIGDWNASKPVGQTVESQSEASATHASDTQTGESSSGTIVTTSQCSAYEQGSTLSKDTARLNFKVSERYGGFLVADAIGDCFKGRKLLLKAERDGFIVEKLIPQPSESVAGLANGY